jgi:hypothetical protein
MTTARAVRPVMRVLYIRRDDALVLIQFGNQALTGRVVTDWVIFLFIVFVIAVDDIVHELLWSFATTRAAVLDRLKSLRQKLRSLGRRARR